MIGSARAYGTGRRNAVEEERRRTENARRVLRVARPKPGPQKKPR